MPRSGIVRLALAALLLLPAAVGCRSVAGYGFAGGGLPQHVRTVAVLPFDNRTPESQLQRELQELLQAQFERRLGLRIAPEGRANAVVRGTITRFDPDVPVAYSADPTQTPSARRRLLVAIDVEVVDQVSGETLWSRQGLSQEGEYAERDDETGRRQALERIVNDIIEGVQSQW